MGRINLIGLEVEGGWDGEAGKRPFASQIIADRSIDGQTLQTDHPLTCVHIGEVVSKPMASTPESVNEWIDTHWPKHTNITCGYHIHTSYASMKDYCALTTKYFLTGLVSKILEQGKMENLPPTHYLFKRMTGSNPFTLYNFDASNQIRMKAKAVGDRLRYGMINCAWNIHGTLEFRGYPTFETPELAKTFTFLYLNYIESFLAENSNKFAKPYSATLREFCGETSFTLHLPKELD